MSAPDYTRALEDSIRAVRSGETIRPATDGGLEFYCQRCSRLTDGPRHPHCPACLREIAMEQDDAARWGRR